MEEKSKVYFVLLLVDSVKYVYPEVKGLCYWINKETSEEFVRVHYRKNNMILNFDICVTADSLNALVLDVWKGLERRLG